jgi:hypothetical protein
MMLHVFKFEISGFNVMALAERQKDSLLKFCYGYNKAWGFFPIPKINSSGVTFSMISSPSFNGDAILFTTSLPFSQPVIQILI